jgi:hypothetical protein
MCAHDLQQLRAKSAGKADGMHEELVQETGDRIPQRLLLHTPSPQSQLRAVVRDGPASVPVR